MKRGGGTRPFSTLGTRMRDFGRSLMRHYVPPQDLPAFNEPPAPGWANAAQTPLMWPEGDAPAGFPQEDALADDFTGITAEDTPGQRRAPRPAAAQPLPAQQQPPVQRKPAPAQNKTNPQLLNMLQLHREREAERERIREERKANFEAAELQRQADPSIPPPRRRGRMGVDYVETSALSQGEEAASKPTTPSPAPETPQQEAVVFETPEREDGDTVPLDVHAIQAKLAEDNIHWQPAPEPADEDWAATATPDSNDDSDISDDDHDSDVDDGGTPPRFDPPPPMPSPGIAQRTPDFDSPAESETYLADTPGKGYTAPPVERDDRPADSVDFVDVDAPASSPAIQRDDAYQPFVEAYEDDDAYDPGNDFAEDRVDHAAPASRNDGATSSRNVQRAQAEQSAADAGMEFAYEQPEADNSRVGDAPPDHAAPIFHRDADDTRPMAVQRAPVLPPDFADESGDFAQQPLTADETAYDTLTDWVDAHSETPPVQQAPNRVVQARHEQPPAPERAVENMSFDQPDEAGETEFTVDDGDTRPLAVQRASAASSTYNEETLQFPPSDSMTGFEPLYPQGETVNLVDTAEAWSGDVPTAAAQADVVQRAPVEDAVSFDEDPGDYAAPLDADFADDAEEDAPLDTFTADEAIYDDGEDFDQPIADADPAQEWGREASTADAPPMPQTVQRQPTPPFPDAVETHARAAFDDEAFAEDAYEVVAPEYASEEQGEAGDDFTADDGYSDQPASTFQPPAPDSVQRQPDPVEHDEFNETGVADGFAEAAENDDSSLYASPHSYTGDEDADSGRFAPPQQPIDTPVPTSVQRRAEPVVEQSYSDETTADTGDFTAEAEYDAPESVADPQAAFGLTDEPYVEAETVYDYTDDAPAYTTGDESADYDVAQAGADVGTVDSDGTVQRAMQPHTPEPGTPFRYEPPMSGFPGDDVYQTDISRLDGSDSQPVQPRRVQRRPAAQRDETATPQNQYDTEAAPAQEDIMGDSSVDLYQATMGAGMLEPSPDAYAPETYAYGGDSSAPPGHVQRTPDEAAPEQPLDLYQAMMGAGMLPPSPDDPYFYASEASALDTVDAGYDLRPTSTTPNTIQRAPEEDVPEQPLDLYEAMRGAGMLPPAHDDDYAPDVYYPPPEIQQPMSSATKADLLDLLDTSPRPPVSAPPGSENIVARVYQPPEPARPSNPPAVIQRAETDERSNEEPSSDAQDDVNVDQLARDVYSMLRNRLRIERERRDRKP